jgi:transposase-like protein
MEMEVEAAAGAARGERSAVRTAQRNGYRERPLGEEEKAGVQRTPAPTNRAGRIELAIPRLRKGGYLPSFLEPRRTAETRRAARSSEGARGRDPG